MQTQTETTSLLLPEVLDLAASEGFLDMMRKSAAGGGPLRLDASAVRMLTLPCAQIVVAAVRSGEDVKLIEPSNAFTSAFDDLGLDWMGCLDPNPPARQEPEAVIEAAAGDAADAEPESAIDKVYEQGAKTRILTIDDSKTMRDMLKLTLDEAGFDVIQAVDGQDGLNVLVNEQVDVIITDINMPIMDGYEVIRNLRRDPAHKSTPILVLTTESDSDKKNLAREAGATGWMVKPFDPDRLVATVRKVAPQGF
jgi:two-component system chemotaxis response regulator CheY